LCEEKLVVFFAQTGHEHRKEVSERRRPNHLKKTLSAHLEERKSLVGKLTLTPNLSNNGPPKRFPPNKKKI
jgi:hypothetical protein